ncbi:hypothetical protein WJX72_001785 [[Myrmecia] bisecta]|uniref:F-box domain-containing protein n=1 Tax=[Myrmecia] bisecta TaxID=41462 RepID=A0AAW1QQ02_9CHLO
MTAVCFHFAQAMEWMSVLEQAEIALQSQGPGRRIYVDLKQTREVNWKKLLKQRGAAPAPSAAPAAAPLQLPGGVSGTAQAPPAGPAAPRPLLEPSRRPEGGNFFSSVIQKLEQAYVLNREDSESDEEPAERRSPGSPRSDDGQKGGADDMYDLEDDWIDDSEMYAYYAGDRRKTKHTGFFINKGTIEKTGEMLDADQPPTPKKRRKKVRPAGEGAQAAGADGAAKEAPVKAKRKLEDGQAKPAKKAKKAAGAAEGGMPPPAPRPGSAAAGPSTAAHDAADQASAAPFGEPSGAGTSIAALAAQAGAMAGNQAAGASGRPPRPPPANGAADSSGRPYPDGRAGFDSPSGAQQPGPTTQPSQAAVTPQASQGGRAAFGRTPGSAKRGGGEGEGEAYEIPPELQASMAAMREATMGVPTQEGKKQLPKKVRDLLPAFACQLLKETAKTKCARSVILSELMSFLEPYTSRPNLTNRLKDLQDKAEAEYRQAGDALKACIDARLPAMTEGRLPGPQPAASTATDASNDDSDFAAPSSQMPSQTPASFRWVWDRATEDCLYQFLQARMQVRSGGLQGTRGAKAWEEVCSYWPPGWMDGKQAQAGYLAGKRRNKMRQTTLGSRASSEHTQPASSGLPAATADMRQGAGGTAGTAAAAQQQAALEPEQRVLHRDDSITGPPAHQDTRVAESGGQNPVGAAPVQAPVRPPPADWETVAAAVAFGADQEECQRRLVKYNRGTAKDIVNRVLMHAGPEGLGAKDTILAAARLNIADWAYDKSKASQVSTILNQEQHFVHVGNSRFSQSCFPGVSAVPSKRSGPRNAASQAANAGGVSRPGSAELPDEAGPATQAPVQASQADSVAPEPPAAQQLPPAVVPQAPPQSLAALAPAAAPVLTSHMAGGLFQVEQPVAAWRLVLLAVQMDYIALLPTEVLEQITQHLATQDLSNAQLVSKAWKRSFGLTGCNRLTAAGLLPLTSLTGLRQVDLSGCKSVSGAGLAVLTRLQRLSGLSCDKCELLGDAELHHLGQLTALRELSLMGCDRIKGSGLRHLSSLFQMRSLNLAALSQLEDDHLGALASLTALRTLNLGQCILLRGQGLTALRPLTALETLTMRQCAELTNAGLCDLAGLQSLKHVNLDFCEKLTDMGVAMLGALTALRSLSLRGCQKITGSSFSALAALPELQTLVLTWATGINLQGGRSLAQLRSLESLNLSCCERVDDAFLQALAALSGLKSLSLSGCLNVTCRGMQMLTATTKQLTALDMNGCSSVRDVGLQSIGRLTSLISLNLGNCLCFTDQGLAGLTSLLRLTELNLARCNVTDQGVQPLAQLPELVQLNLWGCLGISGVLELDLPCARIGCGNGQ